MNGPFERYCNLTFNDNIQYDTYHFINSSIINCLIDPISNYNSSILHNITISINGKISNETLQIFILPTSINEGHKRNYKLISLIVIAPFLSLKIYKIYKKHSKSKKHKKENSEMIQNVRDMLANEEKRFEEEEAQLKRDEKESIENNNNNNNNNPSSSDNV